MIPARWGSSRFPGKVLATLGSRPLLLHVCELARRAARVREIVVATDDDRVAEVARGAGYRAERTRADHASGTDRVAEVAARLEADFVIGLQADEPFLAPADVDALADALAGPGAPALATLGIPLLDPADFANPNVVKVVTTPGGRALYFSRSPIPYPRPGHGTLPFPPPAPAPGVTWRHLGVYGWRRDALLRFATMGPSVLERTEGLEQLRALEAGWPIAVLRALGEPFGVDTLEDLARAEERLARRSGDSSR
ncbi:MAG: 3-deoxy-manno-octulosonate cytidylyltransferase [Acidobacteria bacterium]|nr:3-deoxy-manno-octulosonate cytidylyltransferase [Acidobacteriota bacterium]